MIDEQELRKALDELGTHIRTVKAYMQELENKLNELTIAAATPTPTPKLPEEPGWYLTQQHLLLLKDSCGDWSVRNINGRPIQGYWGREGSLDCYAKDPKIVYAALGPDAFPLVPIEDVQLPSSKG